jgi:hypothetical protein
LIKVPEDFHNTIAELRAELRKDPEGFVPPRTWRLYSRRDTKLIPKAKDEDKDDFVHKTSLQRHYLKNRQLMKERNAKYYKKRNG